MENPSGPGLLFKAIELIVARTTSSVNGEFKNCLSGTEISGNSIIR